MAFFFWVGSFVGTIGPFGGVLAVINQVISKLLVSSFGITSKKCPNRRVTYLVTYLDVPVIIQVGYQTKDT